MLLSSGFRTRKHSLTEINNHNNLDVNLNDVLIVVVEPLRLKPLFYLITDCGDLLSCRVEGALPLTSVKLRL